MVISELRIYEFLTGVLKIEDSVAKRYVQDIVRAEEKLENQVETRIDKKFEESKNELATKEDIHNLHIDIEKLRSEFLVVKWMLGVLLAGIISLVIKTFF